MPKMLTKQRNALHNLKNERSIMIFELIGRVSCYLQSTWSNNETKIDNRASEEATFFSLKLAPAFCKSEKSFRTCLMCLRGEHKKPGDVVKIC